MTISKKYYISQFTVKCSLYSLKTCQPNDVNSRVDNLEKNIYPKSFDLDESMLIIKQSLVLYFHIQDGHQQWFKMDITPLKMKIKVYF